SPTPPSSAARWNWTRTGTCACTPGCAPAARASSWPATPRTGATARPSPPRPRAARRPWKWNAGWPSSRWSRPPRPTQRPPGTAAERREPPVSRARTVYICQECAYRSPRWLGRCPGCGGWNTMAEERQPHAPAGRRDAAGRPVSPVLLTDAGEPHPHRPSTGSGELDRVLGGGIVPGSLVLIGGDPGIGKSTLLLQVAAHVAASQGNFLYISGEESAAQVAMRGRRLGIDAGRLYLLAETDIRMMEQAFDE